MWGSSDSTYSKADERVNYKYIQVFNETTNEITKKKLGMNKYLDRFFSFLELFYLLIVLAAMVSYNIYSPTFKG